MMMNMIIIINWIVLWYFIFLSFGYLLLLAGAIPEILTRFKETEMVDIFSILKSHVFPPVSIIISNYNDEKLVVDAVQSALNSNYGSVFIIIVNDGSTDVSLQKLIDKFQLYAVEPMVKNEITTVGKTKGYYISKTHPNITLIDKQHTDKSDSLNVGLNSCLTPLFICMDADTLIEPDAINKIIFYFIRLSYPVAVGGSVYILNGCQYQQGVITHPQMSLRPIHMFQTCEYLRSFLFARSGWNLFGGALCYAGAFTLINYHTIVEIGGYDVDNLAQDFEVITHLHEHKREKKLSYSVGYTPAAVAWTRVPNTLASYWKQRINWQYFSLESLMKHKKMLFNPKFGVVGIFTYPFYFFGEILGALIECLAYLSVILSIMLGILDLRWAVLFIIVCWGFSTFLTMATALLSFITFNQYKKVNDVLFIFLFSIIENFGFRQFNVLCRTTATMKYMWDHFKRG